MEILREGRHNIYTKEAESENAGPIGCCSSLCTILCPDNFCSPSKVCT